MTKWAPTRIKVFADGANLDSMVRLASEELISGLTTNPTLMRQSGVADYREFVVEALRLIPDKPISFEVFADDPTEMLRQARIIAKLGGNVYVKIPVTTTSGRNCGDVIQQAASEGVKLNVTAITTAKQVSDVAEHLDPDIPAVVSVFAGRIADTGRDPVPVMAECRRLLADLPRAELLWASPREVLNVIQAEEVGCHIITVTPDLIRKFDLIGKDLDEYSLETVRMFRDDAVSAGFRL